MEASKPAIPQVVNDMVERIASAFDPDRVLLFGSYARGTAEEGSDVDLLVVMPVVGSRRSLATEIDRLLIDRMIPLDIIVVTPEEFERNQSQVGTAVRSAVQGGQVVYERAA